MYEAAGGRVGLITYDTYRCPGCDKVYYHDDDGPGEQLKLYE